VLRSPSVAGLPIIADWRYPLPVDRIVLHAMVRVLGLFHLARTAVPSHAALAGRIRGRDAQTLAWRRLRVREQDIELAFLKRRRASRGTSG
jgi:hypothetical protein